MMDHDASLALVPVNGWPLVMRCCTHYTYIQILPVIVLELVTLPYRRLGRIPSLYLAVAFKSEPPRPWAFRALYGL